MRDERVRQRRSSRGRKNRNNDGFGRRNSFLTMDKGIEARAKEPEMNRVSECKEKQEFEVKKAAVGSMWKGNHNDATTFMVVSKDGEYVNLHTGRYSYITYNFNRLNSDYHEVFCVTIERDPDEQ